MRVLVTRPRVDAVRTAEQLALLGHEALIDPVIEIEPIAYKATGEKFSAIAFTSANGARSAAGYEHLKSIPVFAVGERTAEAAREAGYAVRGIAEGDVNALGEMIAAALSTGMKVLHLAGEDRAGDLSAHLARSGIGLETGVIYRARISESLQPETVAAFKAQRIGAVLHYSQRSAAIFVKLADEASLRGAVCAVRHCCISEAAAIPLRAYGAPAAVAEMPSETGLFDLLRA